MSDCAFASRVASNIGLGLGALQVSPNLECLFNSDNHSFLWEDRYNPVVWLQLSQTGGHVSHGFGREV